MDKLKYIKLENEDGSYSDSIPLAVDSDHVDVNGDTLTNELGKKASTALVNTNTTNLQNQINSLASGSPKGVYETTVALVNANPDTGVYIVTADGHIYSWTKNASSAVDLGVYQATEIEDNSIKQSKMFGAVLSQYGNLIEYEKVTKNTTINSDGTESYSYARDASDYIPILENCRYRFGNNNAGVIAYYDENKNHISNQAPNTSNLVMLTIPENAKFFRVTMYQPTYGSYGPYPYVALNVDQYVGSFGTSAGSPTITQAIYTKNDIAFDDLNYINNSINDIKFDIPTFNKLNQTTGAELSNLGNLFDVRAIIKNRGFTNTSPVENFRQDMFVTSYLISIIPNHTYQRYTTAPYYMKFYDQDMEELSTIILQSNANFDSPENAYFAKISGYLYAIQDKTSGSFLQIVDREQNRIGGPNQIVDPIYTAPFLYHEQTDLYPQLRDKKMIFFGDSWCAGNTSFSGGWSTYIKNNTINTICSNKGQNGSSWFQCYNNYLRPEIIEELDPTFDIICIEAFTNGFYGENPYKEWGDINETVFNSIEEINSEMPDSIVRDIERCLFSFSNYYKGKRICIIIPYQARAQKLNNSCFYQSIPIVEQIAKKYEIKVFNDFYSSNVPYWDRTYFWDEGEDTEETKIGVHLNEKGYNIISKNIIQHLNNWA